MVRYNHTQIGHLPIIVLIIALLIIAIIMAMSVFSWIAFSVMIILGICLLFFCTLTTTIRDDVFELSYGPGLVRKRFYLKDIESCQAVKNPWYYGWGIHLTPYGWLFNVSGFHAIQIKLKSGKTYRIGTNVPNELEKVLNQAIGVFPDKYLKKLVSGSNT